MYLLNLLSELRGMESNYTDAVAYAEIKTGVNEESWFDINTLRNNFRITAQE